MNKFPLLLVLFCGTMAAQPIGFTVNPMLPATSPLTASFRPIFHGLSDPAACTPGVTPWFFNDTGTVMKYCSAANTWTALPASPISGSGANTELTFWNGTDTVTGDPNLTWNGSTLQITGHVYSVGGVVTTSSPPVQVVQTWNSGGVTFTGLLENIADSASASASLLADLQIGGSSKFSVRKDGAITSAALTSGRVTFAGAAGLLSDSATLLFSSPALSLVSDSANIKLGASSNAGIGFNGAGIVEINNGTLGSIRDLYARSVYYDGNARFSAGGIIGWVASGTAFNALDTDLSRISAGVIGVGTGAQGSIAGSLELTKLLVGGATSSFPMLKNSSATLAVRLADDSADAAITAGAGTFSSTLSLVSAGSNALPTNTTLWATGAGGTSTTVLQNRISLGVDTNHDYGAYIGALDPDGSHAETVIGVRQGGSDFPSIWLNSGGCAMFGDRACGTSGVLQSTGRVYMTSLSAGAGTVHGVCIDSTTHEIEENAAANCTVSSRIFKTGIAPLALQATPLLMAMQPAEFAYKDDPTRMRFGFIAEDMAAINRRLGDGYNAQGDPRSLDQLAIEAIEVKTIQEQKLRIDALESEIEALKAKVN